MDKSKVARFYGPRCTSISSQFTPLWPKSTKRY